MNKLICAFSLLYFLGLPFYYALGHSNPQAADIILALSEKKWEWIMHRQLDSLDALFHEKLIFRQAAVKMDKPGYMGVIENGSPYFRHVETLETDIQVVEDLSILYTKVQLTARDKQRAPQINEVTEVYQNSPTGWKLITFQMSRDQGSAQQQTINIDY